MLNILRIQLERQDVNYFPSLREYAMIYGVNKELLDSLENEIVVIIQDLLIEVLN